MYTINYVDGLVTKEKYGDIIIKVLKVANLFVHVAIVVLIIMSILAHSKINTYNDRINYTKNSIEQKRVENKIEEKEKEWDSYYYKLLAIKEQLDNNTNYGFIFKDLGIYFPEQDSIMTVSCKGDEMTVDVRVKAERLKDMNSFYDYAKILQTAFDKSTYIGKEILVDSVKDSSNNVSVLEVRIPIFSRK